MRKTTIEIIDEIANHYNSDNRSVQIGSTNICMYSGPDGKRCAYAYLFPEDKIYTLKIYEGGPINKRMFERTSKHMKSEYAGHPVDFYVSLQIFHDDYNNFTPDGLSSIGEREVTKLKQRYGNS